MEDRFYDAVAAEIASGFRDQGLMARAIAESRGNEPLAQSLYIGSRVEKLAEHERSEQKAAKRAARVKKFEAGLRAVTAALAAMLVIFLAIGLLELFGR